VTGSRVVDGYLFCLALLAIELALVGLGLGASLGPRVACGTVLAIFPLGAVLLAPIAAVVGAVVEIGLGKLLSPLLAPLASSTRARLVGSACTASALGWLFFASRAGPGSSARDMCLLVAIVFAASLSLAYGKLDLGAPTAADRHRMFGRGAAALAIFGVATLLLSRSISSLRGDAAPTQLFSEHAPLSGRIIDLASKLDPEAPTLAAAPPPSSGETGPLDASGWDVLLISVASLRADHLGAYGYDRDTSPNLDRLAREGVLFEDAYTSSPVTSYALASMLTGKYMRPLLEMELGGDSETLAATLRKNGYKTAAFYNSALFASDESKLAALGVKKLGFESIVENDAPGRERPKEVARHLDKLDAASGVFTWVHLDEPHEPYVQQGESFGSRDIDRYDSEIAEADAVIAALIKEVRARRPKTLVIVTADHGEEFGEHGGRYHGTSVYEEQVRVPLLFHAPELLMPRRVKGTVEIVDLVPTVLAALALPAPPRLRGHDLRARLMGIEAPNDTVSPALSETDEMSLLAEGRLRLVCLRRAGACSLYDLDQDPRQRRDVASLRPRELSTLRGKLRAMEALHAKREREGRETADALPEPLRRALAGDVDAAIDIAALLDDADPLIRRKAAAALFELYSKDVTPALRAALTREKDVETKAYIALALVRLGEGAPHVFELFEGSDLGMRRLAALALAEASDGRGEDELLAWWRAAYPNKRPAAPEDVMSFARARQVLSALALRKSKDSVGSLLVGLRDERLRPHVARALAKIGEDAARPGIAEWLYNEPHLNTRIALTEALLELGGGPELRDPLVSFLGMPEPLPNGIKAALDGDILAHVGGPARDSERNRLRRFAQSGVLVDFVVPDLTRGAVAPLEGPKVRVLCRATTSGAGEIRAGARGDVPKSSEKKAPIPANRPALDSARSATMLVPVGDGPVEVFADLPDAAGARPGKQASLVFFATQGVEIQACVLVPRRDALATEKPRQKNSSAPSR